MVKWKHNPLVGKRGEEKEREDKAPGRPYCSLPVPDGRLQESWRGTFTGRCSDRTRPKGFRLKERRDLD